MGPATRGPGTQGEGVDHAGAPTHHPAQRRGGARLRRALKPGPRCGGGGLAAAPCPPAVNRQTRGQGQQPRCRPHHGSEQAENAGGGRGPWPARGQRQPPQGRRPGRARCAACAP